MKSTRRASNCLDTESLAVKELASLSEKELQSEIIEPLLRKLGFRNVQDTSGHEEYGKDLIATKADEFGHTLLYAIQIKKLKPSAKVASATSFGRLLDQLRQAIEEVVIDPTTNEQRSPDRCLFITPYPIPAQVRKAFHQRMKEPIFRTLRIVDGPRLLEQIQAYLPAALTRFSKETQYRLQMESYTNKIVEAGVAFDLGEGLELDAIYVDVVLWQKDSLLERLDAFHEKRAISSGRKLRMTKVLASVEDIKQLISIYKGWKGFSTRPLDESLEKAKPEFKIVRNAQTGEKQKIISGYFTEIELASVFDPACHRVRSYLDQIPKLSAVDISMTECTQIAHEGIQLRRDLRHFRKTNLVRKHWDSLLDISSTTPPRKTNSITASSLLKIRECLYITGGPGSGKTTLLRRLSQTIAWTKQNELPLYLPLITVEEPSYNGLVQACVNELNKRGYGSSGRALSVKSFLSLVDGSKFRLLLDGLDEAGAKADDLMKAIDAFAKKHKKSNVILSSRDTFGFEAWGRAYAIGLEPFSEKQLESFVGKWFSSQPTSKRELLAWLAKNPKMRASAQTPLVAALLCSLFQLKADMPSTEVDLYEQRFELLLGRWDRAKGVQPLRTEIRKRYLHFLMAFAFYLHTVERRSATFKEATDFARRYYDEQFHRTPEAMVQECIRRGLFEYDQGDSLSFGHLTYQEYLAAEWLCHHGAIKFIWSRILTPWWTKTLEFYASRKLDITPVVKNGLNYRGESSSFDRVCELVKLAPLTSKDVMDKFRRLLRTESLPQYRWDVLPRPPSSF